MTADVCQYRIVGNFNYLTKDNTLEWVDYQSDCRSDGDVRKMRYAWISSIRSGYRNQQCTKCGRKVKVITW